MLCFCVSLWLSAYVFDSVFTRDGSVLNGTKEKKAGQVRTTFLSRPCALVAERIVAAVHLDSATLRSFRHSCSGRPPSLPAALLMARLYTRGGECVQPGPNHPLSCKEILVTPIAPFPYLFVLFVPPVGAFLFFSYDRE